MGEWEDAAKMRFVGQSGIFQKTAQFSWKSREACGIKGYQGREKMCLSLRKDRQFTGCGTQIKGRSEKERERLPCGIKLISLLSLHQNLAFKLARRL